MKILKTLLFLFASTALSAQNNENVIKLNIGSLFVKNIALQYERATGTKTSLALGIRFQPYGNVPFQEWIKDQIDEPDVQVGLARIGNFAITPEFRYYFKQKLRGLYIAPYLRYANYKAEAPVTYTGTLDTRTAFFNGNISSFSGGVLFGNQFRLSDNLVLDFWIIGGHIGGSSGQLDFVSPLTPAEQEDLRETLDDLSIPFFDIEYNIHSNGGTITSRGAWAGFRGLGVNLGVRF